jgi:hypothetical protein
MEVVYISQIKQYRILQTLEAKLHAASARCSVMLLTELVFALSGNDVLRQAHTETNILLSVQMTLSLSSAVVDRLV